MTRHKKQIKICPVFLMTSNLAAIQKHMKTKISSSDYSDSLCMQKIFFAVFTAAPRSSLKRQQNKNGLIEEFVNTKVVAKFHSVGQGFCESP